MKRPISFGPLPLAGCLAVACSSSGGAPPAPSSHYGALVAASDYTSSEIGLVGVGGSKDFASGIDLGNDPTLASSAGRYFWVARDSARVIEIDGTTLQAKGTFDANDPGATSSSDPYDVAVAPDGSLWVARFAVPSILVLNADGTRRMTVDLSSLDPADGNPDMSSIRILDPETGLVGTMSTARAYVSLGVLDGKDGLRSTRSSKLARVDLQTGAVEDVLTLAGRNPIARMAQLGAALYLADAGTWCLADECPAGQPDSGVERVDTASFTSKLLVTGVTLGGHATELAVTSTCGVVIVAGPLPTTPTSLVRFDPAGNDGATQNVLPTTTSFTLEGLAWVPGNVLLVGDRGAVGASPVARLFDADVTSGCALAARASSIALPLPPVGFVALASQ